MEKISNAQRRRRKEEDKKWKIGKCCNIKWLDVQNETFYPRLQQLGKVMSVSKRFNHCKIVKIVRNRKRETWNMENPNKLLIFNFLIQIGSLVVKRDDRWTQQTFNRSLKYSLSLKYTDLIGYYLKISSNFLMESSLNFNFKRFNRLRIGSASAR